MSVGQLLTSPIPWTNWHSDQNVRAVLSQLQANILKGHGRHHTLNIFFDFSDADAATLRKALRNLAEAMPSALDQLLETQRYRVEGGPGRTMMCLLLGAGGYEKLGVPQDKRPGDAAFRSGMAARGEDMHDTLAHTWDAGMSGADAMLLLGDVGRVDSQGVAATPRLDQAAAFWSGVLTAAGAKESARERGQAIFRKVAGDDVGIEHFGYVDGRSQPLVLQEDVRNEPRISWNPAFPPENFLVEDAAAADPDALGAYFVFRKLEQDVAGFKTLEGELGEALVTAGLPVANKGRAGALMVGRFEDGTPVMLSPYELDAVPPNDFNYAGDQAGVKCPFMAHIRKTNPRGESAGKLAHLGVTPEAERAHIMIRRGITYGERVAAELADDDAPKPSKGVGLLFMAYMKDIANQFEFTQKSWANFPDFVETGTGIDPVIGQADDDDLGAVKVGDGWSGTVTKDPFSFKQHVHLKGGEYFFAPSLTMLRGL